MAGVGVVILVVMLSICVSVVWRVLLAFGVAAEMWMIWLGVGVVLIPLLFWTEIRTRGGYFEDAAGSFGGGADGARSYGEYRVDQAQAAVAFYTELLLSGPRFVLEGAGMRRRRGKVDEGLMMRAADVLRDLLSVGEGMTIGQLRREGEETEQLLAAIRYLEEHEWIGRSRDGKRVWLQTEGRLRLEPKPGAA